MQKPSLQSQKIKIEAEFFVSNQCRALSFLNSSRFDCKKPMISISKGLEHLAKIQCSLLALVQQLKTEVKSVTELLTIEDIKRQLNCATSTVYRWIEKEEFPPPIKIGGMARWQREDLEQFLAAAVRRRCDAGPRPANVRRGRKPDPRKTPRFRRLDD